MRWLESLHHMEGIFLQTMRFKHIFDITDFASILKDSVKIRALHWRMGKWLERTLDFEFIKGVPP